MTIAERIIKAMEFTGLPIAQTSYAGDANAYIVFRQNAMPDGFGDDAPGYDVVLVTVHLFAPFTMNTSKLKSKIRKAIFDIGATYPTVVDVSENARSGDGTEQHIVFECEIEEVIDDGIVI